jgi:hypothetical protein
LDLDETCLDETENVLAYFSQHTVLDDDYSHRYLNLNVVIFLDGDELRKGKQ